jgi:signal transduction histidine kinase/DNA-binding response OmpR family regulator
VDPIAPPPRLALRPLNSLQFRLSAVISLLVLLVVVSVGSVLINRHVESLVLELRREATLRAQGLARQLGPALEFDDREAVRGAFDALADDEDLKAMALYESDGKLVELHGAAPPRPLGPPPSAVTVEALGETMEVLSPVFPRQGKPGLLWLRISSSRIHTTSLAAMWNAFFVGISVLLLALVAAWWIARYVSQRLARIARVAVKVAEGDLTQDPIVPELDDEIGQLTVAFNSMLATMNGFVDKLQEAAQNVETSLNILVAERTRELANLTVELGQTNRELEVTRDLAVAANRTKSAFLANMSHELRTPLNAIIGYSEMLLEEVEDSPSQTKDLKRIQSSGKHLLALINDILDLSKIEAGKMELFLEEFDTMSMLSEVESTVLPLVATNANMMQMDVEPTLPPMIADLTKVRQVLFNLLSNASKFTQKGAVELKVRRHLEGDQGWMTFTIRDTGIGMTPEQMGGLFKDFSQADASTTRKFGGTGLGLAISKRFCEMMGGTITVESEIGRGTTFTVRLPERVAVKPAATLSFISGAHPKVTPSPPPQPQPQPPADPGKPTLLVIDDDPNARDLISRLGTQEGLRVITAANGTDGLLLAQQARPSAIALDVMMPGMDGWAVLTHIKADPVLCGIPVVMMTMDDNREMGHSLGADEHLTKPVERDRLTSFLQKYAQTRTALAGTVLVVSDEPDSREQACAALRRDGQSVQAAPSGESGLAVALAQVPALVVLDLHQAGMDAFAVLRRLREHHATRSLPVVLLTAAKSDRALDPALELVLPPDQAAGDGLVHGVRALLARQGAPVRAAP